MSMYMHICIFMDTKTCVLMYRHLFTYIYTYMQTYVYIYTHEKIYEGAYTNTCLWKILGIGENTLAETIPTFPLLSGSRCYASIPVCVEMKYFPMFQHSWAFFTFNIALELWGGRLCSIFLEWVCEVPNEKGKYPFASSLTCDPSRRVRRPPRPRRMLSQCLGWKGHCQACDASMLPWFPKGISSSRASFSGSRFVLVNVLPSMRLKLSSCFIGSYGIIFLNQINKIDICIHIYIYIYTDLYNMLR